VLIGATAVVSFLLGLVSAGSRPVGSISATQALPMPASAERARPLTLASGAAASTGAVPAGVDFAAVAERLNAAVVNVDNASRGVTDSSSGFPQRYRRDFSDSPNGPTEGSGSGFVIDPAGFILTNYHVIEGADRVTVTLSDGRAERATVVGIDPAIDIALLKISTTEPLAVAPLGRSDALRVGEWVCAIGNPLGYVHSVTVGVVSFLGRKVFDQSLDALIQTDAAITFGNSGGPLINDRGEVVGMTTAVSALASNIGFAIPIDQIVEILPQLREHGRVSRGFIGVGLAAVTPSLDQALHLGSEQGALVQDVTPGMPAERAGLRTYDVILKVDDVPIASDETLIQYISLQRPGTVTTVELLRDGRRMTLAVKLAERPLPATPRPRAVSQNVRPATAQELGPLGFSVKDLDASARSRWGIPSALEGVWVSLVDPAGPGRQARISEGHVILEMNRAPIRSASDFRAAVSRLRPGETVALLVLDRLSDQRVVITVSPDPQGP
jgi:serine protease Do